MVTQVVVDHLEAVQIEEQKRDRARLAELQPVVKVGDQRPAVQQVGEIVVFGEIEQPILSHDARLNLGQQ